MAEGKPALKRSQSAGAVRTLQFQTARRILFGDDLVPGTDRPFWTSAGFLRQDRIQYRRPFTLGDYTFVILEGNVTADPVVFSAGVWLKVPTGPLEVPNDAKHIWTTKDYVCIGVLRSDVFIPMMPNLVETIRFEATEYTTGQQLEVDDVISYFQGGQVYVRKIIHINGNEDEDFHLQGARLRWRQRNNAALDAAQIPGDVPPSIEGGTGPLGSNLQGTELEWVGAIPLDIVTPIFPFNMDMPAITRLPADLDPRLPCIFSYSRRLGGVLHTTFTAWLAWDIAHITSAQSWLIHVLTGLDRRRFIRDRADQSPMKEERLPEIIFWISPEISLFRTSGMYSLKTAHSRAIYQSLSEQVVFFQMTDATRTARDMLRELTRDPDQFAHELKAVLSNPAENPDRFGDLMFAISRSMRFQELEFFGDRCDQCFEANATLELQHTPVKVCSKSCFSKMVRNIL